MQFLRASTFSWMLLMLAACSGGGGGGSPSMTSTTPPPTAAASFSISTNTLMFSASSPTAATPAPQTVSATVNGTVSGTLFVLVDVLTGGNVVSVSSVTLSGSNGGRATVTPAAPSALGAGTFTSQLRVRACMNDSSCATGQLAGSPQVINVTYVITAPVSGPSPDPTPDPGPGPGPGPSPDPGPTPGPGPTPDPQPPMVDASRDVVAPRVAVANVAGQLILRGVALGGTTSVTLRSNTAGTVVQATGVTQVSATEVRASYPALAAGTYSVQLNAGAVAFTGSLVSVPAVSFASTQLTFTETPDRISTLLYDAERNRLLVATGFPAAPSNNKIFVYRGQTLTRSVTSFANLRDVTFSADGLRLLAITDTEVLELDPDLLTVSRRTTGPTISGGARLQRIAVANDGKAIVTTGAQGLTAATPAFLYDTVTRTFNTTPIAMLNTSGEDRPAGVVATADGSHIYVTQSTSAQSILDYSASNGSVTRSALTFAQMPDQALAVDQSGQRLIPYATGSTPVRVRDGAFNQVGILDVNPIAIAVNRQASRAYVLDNGNMFHNFRLATGVPNTTSFGEVAPSMIITTPATAGTSIKSGVTHDGATVFMAGVRGVIVISSLP